MTLNGKKQKIRRAVGLMTGTSMDGIDAAALETDGRDVVRILDAHACPFQHDLGRRMAELAAMAGEGAVDPDALAAVEAALTDQHAAAVTALFERLGKTAADFDIAGFHGQTILHDPDRGKSWQIGDGQRLADRLGMAVVNDFRSADLAGGGQGAPLAPVYHLARLRADGIAGPVAVLNMGGVGNVTWIGRDREAGAMIAFDTGPGNALIDDWVRTHTGRTHDAGGALAAGGVIDEGALRRLLGHPYFSKRPPKSLDRNAFSLAAIDHLSLNDGAATLTAFTAEAVRRAFALVPEGPARVLVTGGGRHNSTLMKMLKLRLAVPVEPVEAVGWNGDMLEAEAFGYMAVRRLDSLPISFPGTTGVKAPMIGGVIHRPTGGA